MSLDLTGYQSEKDLAGNQQPADGTHMMIVTAVDTQPISNSGSAINGIKVDFQVAASTAAGQVGVEWSPILFYPEGRAKDDPDYWKDARNLAILTRLGLATEVIHHDQLGKTIDPVWEDMQGRPLFIRTKMDGQYCRVDDKGTGAKRGIWHVNDPEAAAFPRDEEVLELMPMTWKPEGAATATQAAAKPAAAAPTKAAAAPKPGAPRPGAKRPAANGNAANGGDRSTAAAAAAEGRPATKADPYASLDD